MELCLSCAEPSTYCPTWCIPWLLCGHIDGSVKERRNSSALAMELHFSCTEPLTYCPTWCIPWLSCEHINGSVKERHNSSVLAMELHLSCTEPLTYCPTWCIPWLSCEHINGSVKERHNSCVLAMELCLSCTEPLTYCPTWCIPWLLMTWWHKEPGHEQPCYSHISPKLFKPQYQKGFIIVMPHECNGIFKPPATQLFVQNIVQDIIKWHNKDPCYWPFVRGVRQSSVRIPLTIGQYDQWIPLTKGQ